MQWKPFERGEDTYDLSHLHPHTLTIESPAFGKHPATTFTVNVTYGLHCFSCDAPKDGATDPSMVYADARHVRVFDFRRYELSKMLPKIVEGLPKRKCRTGDRNKGNFFTVEVVEDGGKNFDYDVFFMVSKASEKGYLNLFIQSAYIRERSTLGHSTAISFLIILHKVLNKIPIKF